MFVVIRKTTPVLFVNFRTNLDMVAEKPYTTVMLNDEVVIKVYTVAGSDCEY